jgi:hypothetical protein
MPSRGHVEAALRQIDSGQVWKLLGEKASTDTNIFKEAVLPVRQSRLTNGQALEN